LSQLPNLSQELRSRAALIRFCLRICIILIFAAFAGIGFGKGLTALLWMSIILCVVTAAIRREPPFGAVLNHWDETIAYVALFSLINVLNHSPAT
jgi:hypothetical protein